ncbi:DNA translocase FtsK [Apilactobacillus ozensis]|nr:DNA translocase FtsK [Apilactobacillus ozensis]
MNHYDGPAFFRKYPINNANMFTKKSTAKQVINQSNKQIDDIKQKSNKALKSSKPVSSKTNGYSESIAKDNPIAKRVAAFQPTKIYEQKEIKPNYYQKPISAEYTELKQQLLKDAETFILLDDTHEDVFQVNDINTPSITIEKVDKENNLNEYDDTNRENDEPKLHNDDIESNQHISESTDKVDETIDKEVLETDYEPEVSSLDSESDTNAQNQALNNSVLDSNISNEEDTASNVSTEDEKETSTSDATKTFEKPESNALANEKDNIGEIETNNSDAKNIADDSSNNSETNQSKLNVHRSGLGHSLNSILDEEQDAQKDLALFKDKPVKSVDNSEYQYPSLQILNEPKTKDDEGLDDWIENQAEILDETLEAFHVKANVVDWDNGPTVTQFQVKLKLGVKVNKITNLTDDLKLALAAKDIRIEAPIPGKTTVGIEIPNPKPRPVMLSEVLSSDTFRKNKNPLTVALGVDLTGKPQVTDLRKMPHGLIAGATGSGKSVFLNSLLVSLLYKATPAELKMILIDPKAVEMAPYNDIPHLISPVISDAKQASAALNWAVKEMDQRYEKLAASGARNIEQFNKMAEEHEQYGLKMPYILIVIDELADLMMVASAEVQDYIVRITQKARAAGIHLIVATQRPSVDVITGTIKNNIPTRVAFMVSSQVDSRTIIDTAGAERLLGKGDMLYLGNGSSQSMRLQGTFITSKEIEQITEAVKSQGQPNYAFQPKSLLKKVSQVEQQDELMPEVLKYISKEDTISTSKLQRVFSIGYNRAATLIDDLETHNYVSGQHGSKPRDVYLSEEDYKKLNI